MNKVGRLVDVQDEYLDSIYELLSIIIRLVENDKITLAETIIRDSNHWHIDLRTETNFDKDNFMKLAIRFQGLEGKLSNGIQIQNFRSNVNSLAIEIGGGLHQNPSLQYRH
jgi:hypothetical protein